MLARGPAPTKITYYREYGIHPVKSRDSHDYIASFPNWDETIQALKTNMPTRGNIITPEYATISEEFLQLTSHARLIEDRIREAKYATKHSDALLHLGSPTSFYDRYGRSRWLNSVLSIRRGKVESVTHKTTLVPIEEVIGITEPVSDLRTVKNGNAVLICAELFGMFFSANKSKVLQGKNIRQIFTPTMWATPQGDNSVMDKIRQEAGGDDNYYRQQLEHVVGSYVLKHLPTVDRVIISDRGRPDIAPYNSVFDRVR
ncbi:MAG: hypothetical protein QG549_215 [Patescibacteria group bacterium]|nr:hypothetical protein [Patescibacteria group bacterium]